MTAHEFNQLIAEVVHTHGVDAVLPAVERAAHTFGWPIPAQYRENVILGLAILFPTKTTTQKSTLKNPSSGIFNFGTIAQRG